MRRTAFTLIELLVVIAIIVALLAILMPSLARATVAAQIATCASNMRQTIVITQDYASDHFGVLPRHDFPQGIGRNPNAMTRRTAEQLAARGLSWKLWFCPVRGYDLGGDPAWNPTNLSPTSDAQMMDQMDPFAPDWILWPNAWWVPRQAGNGPCPSMNGQTYTLLPSTLRHPAAGTMPIVSDLMTGTQGATPNPSDPRQAWGGHASVSASNSINRGMLDGSVNRRTVAEVEPMIEAGLWWNWY